MKTNKTLPKPLILVASAMVWCGFNLHAQLGPTITNQPASQTVWAGGNVTFAVGVSNTGGAFTYQWQLNSNNLPNIITTVAGMGIPGYSGDGGVATNAELRGPSGVAVDTSGNLFIADNGDNRVRKVDTNGIITSFAGNGTNGYSGDGGVATNANLGDPNSVAVDTSGNLFIGDIFNYRIRKVDTNGIITTVAGNGTNSYSGDGGAATNASLNYPQNLGFDSMGNLYIAGYSDNRVRKIDTNGIIITVAGGGSGGDGGLAINAVLNHPTGVTFDTFGNMYISDCFGNRIRKVDVSGVIMTVAGNGFSGYSGDGGPATNASLSEPYGVAFDAIGNMYIPDWLNNRIRKVTNTQGPVLSLDNVNAANAGNYQLVLTGPGGSITSSVVNLTVAVSPLIYATVPKPDGSVALNFVSQPGSTNVLLYATNLVPPVVWRTVSTNIAGPNGDWQFTDTNAINHQMLFYQFYTQ